MRISSITPSKNPVGVLVVGADAPGVRPDPNPPETVRLGDLGAVDVEPGDGSVERRGEVLPRARDGRLPRVEVALEALSRRQPVAPLDVVDPDHRARRATGPRPDDGDVLLRVRRLLDPRLEREAALVEGSEAAEVDAAARPVERQRAAVAPARSSSVAPTMRPRMAVPGDVESPSRPEPSLNEYAATRPVADALARAPRAGADRRRAGDEACDDQRGGERPCPGYLEWSAPRSDDRARSCGRRMRSILVRAPSRRTPREGRGLAGVRPIRPVRAESYEYVAWQVPVIAGNVAYWTPLIVCTV